MADRSVRVTLTAQAQGYIAEMEKAAQATRETGSATEKLAQQQAAFEQMGRASMVAGGAIAAGLALSTKAAIDWDSAWAGVTKTVDGSPEQLAAVEAGLRGLTSVLPASHTEIAAVAEAAGQLGIETPNVVAFTRTMIDLGETTNLSSEQAAMSLARFVNIMGTSQGDVDRLGSALVGLGNNFATTESEILEMSMRLSKSGVQIGLSEGEVLGLATALSSVGIEAEAGGSAMSKVMIDIASSVEEGGDRVQQFAQIAGMSADAFSEKWKTAPGEALAAFVKGLANAEEQGGTTLGVLAELGITEVRMRDALLGSAAAADKFAGAMEMGNKEFEQNSALTEEAEKRYETTAAKLQIMGNRVVDAAISLGEHLLPAIEGVAEGIGGFADMLSGLDGPMGAVVAWGGLITAGILLTGGAAMAAVPKIAAYKVAMQTLGITGAAVRGRLGGIASFLGGPWGIALGLATASVAGFNAAMDGSKTSAKEFENAIKQGESALDVMLSKANQNESGAMSVLVDVSQHFENLPALADKAAEAGRGFWSSMSFNENAALDSIKEFGSALEVLSATNLPRAQKAFSDFVGDGGLDDTQALTFLNEEMAGFKSRLIDAADAAGLATDDATLLKIALGEIKPAAEDGADGADAGADALDGLQASADATQEAISALAEEIRNFGQAQFDVESATIGFHESLRELQELLDSGTGSLDLTTEAGGNTGKALLDAAKATNDFAAATQMAGGSTEEVSAILESGRQNIINTRIALGETEEQAKAYADRLIATPEAIQTQVQLMGVQAAEAALAALTRTRETFINVVTNGLDTANDALAEAFGSANGNVFAYANGGIAEFANGGITTGIYSGGTPLYKFAEPEVGWEAFISGKPSERDRNRQIWAETGNRLGMNPAGSSAPPVVYVQNPWGEGYLRAKVTEVADARIDVSIQQQAQANRRVGL